MSLEVERDDRVASHLREENREEIAKDRAESSLDELAHAKDHVSALQTSLETQAHAHADLIHLLSHEFRTPITVIAGFSRLLLDTRHGPLSERQSGFVEQNLRACRRLDTLVRDLLEASPEAGAGLRVELCPADLDETISATIASLGPLLTERNTLVDVDVDSKIPLLQFDALRIEQVVTNLLTNAIRYGRAGGSILVGRNSSSTDGERCVEVYVEDDGPGVPEVDRKRIFEPYVRGEGHSTCSGMGIGLAICERIIGAHQGSIRVEEGRSGGARFVFTLPAAPCASEE